MRLWLSAAFFISYLVLQVGLPAVQTFRRHGTFRWGMFAHGRERGEVFAEYADGSRETLKQIQQRTGRAKLLRSEINKRRILPPYLCSLAPTPANILFHNLTTGEEDRYPCR